MGVIGKALSAAAAEPKFVEGYMPDRCWFRNGYVTSKVKGLIFDTIIGSQEMSEEDVVVLCDYMGFFDDSITSEQLISKLDYRLESMINGFQNNRGVPMKHEDEDFVMHMIGWRDYCLMMGIISTGRNVVLIKTGDSKKQRGYAIGPAE